MSELLESTKRGLEEAIVHSAGEPTETQMFIPQQEDDKEVRKKTGPEGKGQG